MKRRRSLYARPEIVRGEQCTRGALLAPMKAGGSKPRTIQTALGELEAAELATGSEEGNGRVRYWSPVILIPSTDGDGREEGTL
jgi:hypothetical protein